MSTSNYDGPRSGDYVRYVDDLLRASPLYRGAVQSLVSEGRTDFTDASSTPGEQSASVLARLREQAQAAVEKAQREAQAAAAKSGQPAKSRKNRSPRQELSSEKAARLAAKELAAAKSDGAKTWFRITPGKIFLALILVAISIALPGLGAMLLLFTIINAVRSGIQSAQKS